MSENLPGNEPASNPVPPAAPQMPAPSYGNVPAPTETKGLAIASLVLGIAGVIFSFLVTFVGFVAGIVGLILGILARKKGQPKGMTLTGIILSAVAIVLSIILFIIAIVVVGSVLNDPSVQQELSDLNS